MRLSPASLNGKSLNKEQASGQLRNRYALLFFFQGPRLVIIVYAFNFLYKNTHIVLQQIKINYYFNITFTSQN